jgi:phosphate uptake regulator
MVWEVFRGSAEPSLDTMVGYVAQMLGDARHVFDAAMGALLGGALPDAIKDDIFATDRRINALEQEIRRELVVHTSVHGTADITSVLIVLMASRKVERIGDNAKNLYDLAATGIDLSHAPDADELRAARDEVSKMMGRSAELFRTEDEPGGIAFLERSWELQRIYDDKMMSYVRTDAPGYEAVPRALFYRYLKRIVANLEGVVSAVVQPLDMIDYGPTGEEESET